MVPAGFAKVHGKYQTPHIITVVIGIGVALAWAFLLVGKLADYSNSGTLFAFAMVAASVVVLRKNDQSRPRPFRAPAIWIVSPVAILGCAYLYFHSICSLC